MEVFPCFVVADYSFFEENNLASALLQPLHALKMYYISIY